jgi:alkylation response protein AidB-like acyl-CoA dehydrogenase
MGWTGLLVPERFGGLGLGLLDAAVLLTELGAAAAPGPFAFSAVIATSTLLQAASARQRRAWLPRLAAGEVTATLAWLEESDRLDPAGIQATARRRGRGYRLSGRKLFVPFARDADVSIVAVRTTDASAREGITLLLVPHDRPGLRFRRLSGVDGTRALFEVELEEVEAEPGDVLGTVGAGWPILEAALDVAAVALAADSLGGADRVLDMAVEYAKTREQFGRPIGSFQAIQHLCAEMAAEIEPARSLLWYAAHVGQRRSRASSRAASMAKAHLGEVYARAARRAVEIHGGIGFTWEHDLHFWFKRAKWNELAFGDPAFHRERAARLGRY